MSSVLVAARLVLRFLSDTLPHRGSGSLPLAPSFGIEVHEFQGKLFVSKVSEYLVRTRETDRNRAIIIDLIQG